PTGWIRNRPSTWMRACRPATTPSGSATTSPTTTPDAAARRLTAPGVTVEDVSRRFGGVEAVSDVSFEIEPGEVLGLLGPNGAGKTTTMRILTGYLRPSSGRVVIGDVDLAADPVAARQQIGYMPESSAVPGEMSVTGFLRYCARLRRVPRDNRKAAVGRSLGQAGLQRVSGQRIGTLSLWYRQRVVWVQALVHVTPVCVLYAS